MDTTLHAKSGQQLHYEQTMNCNMNMLRKFTHTTSHSYTRKAADTIRS